MKTEVTVKLDKRHLYNRSIDYLGHVAAPEKQWVAQKTTEADETLRTTILCS